MGSTLVEEAAKTFQRANIPTYPFPERAASALSALVKRAEFLDNQPLTIDDGRLSTVNGQSSHTEDLLASYEIPTAPIKLARNEQEAIVIANELGFPVVIKIASPDILHKSDVGGVILNIKDAQSFSSAYAQMIKRVKEAKPEAHIDGVHLQRQMGMVRDPQFGALMMFGFGGVEVEGLKDVAFALAPLTQAEAEKMIRKTWAGRKLKGFRNIPAADEESVIDVLIKLSWLVFENEFIEEIEINPLRVLSKGAVAVDVRMRRKGE
jgi:acetyltransferase